MQEKSPKRNDKRKGEWAEAQFVADALRNGYDVFSPIGDSSLVDFVLFRKGELITIQCKATWVDYNGWSKWNIVKGSMSKERYTDLDIDFFALYDGTLNKWRFVRPSQTNGQKTFRVSQNETNNLENWHDLTKTTRRR